MYPYLVRALDLLADVLEVTGAVPERVAARLEARGLSAVLERAIPVDDPTSSSEGPRKPPAVE